MTGLGTPLSARGNGAPAHQQKVKLDSENRPYQQFVHQLLQKLSEWLIFNLPPSFEALNHVIASSWHLKNVFTHLSISCSCFFHVCPLDFNHFDSFFNYSFDFKNILHSLIPWDIDYTHGCQTPIEKIKTLRLNTVQICICHGNNCIKHQVE
jgi:hypothetical protein